MVGALTGVALTSAIPAPLRAQERVSFVRDAEVENTIRAYATPLFAAAGLDPTAIRVHLVNDRSLNAFVAGGLNMFINTGLLMRSENASQVIGVIAHETGHISGGHLVRTRDNLRGAMAETIVAMVLGAAVAAAGGGGAGAAVIAGGTLMAERGLLRYTREMETAADTAAIAVLERTGQSARGLMEFLEVLADQELVAIGRQDPYLRTHPIGRDRVDFVRSHLETSRYANAGPRPEFAQMHRRMRAKLIGFLDASRALQIYKESDTSLEARYARAIAYSRRPDYPRALHLMDQLLAERPNDPYFAEAKGQFLFEAGRPVEALPLYERANQLLPNDPLLMTGLGQVLVDSALAQNNRRAITVLEMARRADPENTEPFRLLAIAYGRDGQIGMANLAQAELAVMTHRQAQARSFADRALRDLPSDSPAWLRAQDIRQAVERRP